MGQSNTPEKLTPLVSVVIPLYNQEDFIASALQSALDQHYPSIEIIIVNDGSQDESLKICQSFSDDRIRIITQKNAGVSGARNTGIRAARGEFIALLDADDLWLPGKLSEHVKLLTCHRQVGVSYNYSIAFDNKNEQVLGYQMMGYGQISPELLLTMNPLGNGSSPVIRASVFDMNHRHNQKSKLPDNYFDTEYPCAEDYVLWTQILLHTDWRFFAIPIPLTRYRIHQNSLSSNLNRQKHYHLRAIVSIAEHFPEKMKKYRCRIVSNFYWYQLGLAYFHQTSTVGLRYIISAIRYDPLNIGPRQLFSCLAYLSSVCLPKKLHTIFGMATLFFFLQLQQTRIFLLQVPYKIHLWRKGKTQMIG